MKKLLVASLSLAAALATSLPAGATLFRTYVASWGSDASPCTLQQPCRLLPAAMAAVSSGGEIWMLDSANFNTGTVVFTKSATILAVPGEVGSIMSMDGHAAVSISAAGIDATLRNVVIANYAPSPGTQGVYMGAGSSLTLEDSVVSGIVAEPVYVQASGAKVKIRNTVIRGAAFHAAVSIVAAASVDISRCAFLGNKLGGVEVNAYSGKIMVDISDTVISGVNLSSGSGVRVWADTGATALANMTRTTIFNTGVGMYVHGAGTAVLTVSGSSISHNGWNLQVEGSAIARSHGNNLIADAKNSDIGTLTTGGLQ